jgi:hypothetical protein
LDVAKSSLDKSEFWRLISLIWLLLKYHLQPTWLCWCLLIYFNHINHYFAPCTKSLLCVLCCYYLLYIVATSNILLCCVYRLVIWKIRLIILKQSLKDFHLRKESKDLLDWYDQWHSIENCWCLTVYWNCFRQSLA